MSGLRDNVADATHTYIACPHLATSMGDSFRNWTHAKCEEVRASQLRSSSTIEGIPYVLLTGCRWQDLPREYGAPATIGVKTVVGGRRKGKRK